MATEVVGTTTPGAQLEEMQTIFPYRAWQQREGIGRVEGYYVEDLVTLPLNSWARKGALEVRPKRPAARTASRPNFF